MKLWRKSALIEQDVYPFVNVGGSAARFHQTDQSLVAERGGADHHQLRDTIAAQTIIFPAVLQSLDD